MLKFLFEQAPNDVQVIVAVEDPGKGLPADTEIRSFGEKRRQVLRDNEFEEVNGRFAPYIQQMLA